MITDKYEACLTFSDYIIDRVISSARGSNVSESENRPSGRFWLGRLCPEEKVLERGMGDRGERLEPCACGIRLQIPKNAEQDVSVVGSAAIWHKEDKDSPWRKIYLPAIETTLRLDGKPGRQTFGKKDCEEEWKDGDVCDAYSLEFEVEVKETGRSELLEVSIQIVNRSKASSRRFRDTNFYEALLRVSGINSVPFELELLPDSFRYDRQVDAYGINCGVLSAEAGTFETIDAKEAVQNRPLFWSREANTPDLSFQTLTSDPIAPIQSLLDEYTQWHSESWSEDGLTARAKDENWTQAMLEAALLDRAAAVEELRRLMSGLELLKSNELVRTAFAYMNEAMAIVAERKPYDSWRPFQIGFILANLESFIDHDADAAAADVVWFATGGGKTETYLGLIVMAAFVDRLEGKLSGVTAWSRFPLRLLSLQQTQRFADALAAAELVRRDKKIAGDAFSLGYLVGKGATPNKLEEDPRDGEPDIEDDSMPARFQVLLRCPFCGGDTIGMRFDRRLWRLEHYCSGEACKWGDAALPFYIVDEEIYRYLPTVLVGTLDKAAIISMQAAMRGLVAPPHGFCSQDGHGFTYASRRPRPTGCLVPGCRAEVSPAPEYSYAPRLRLQDELHLLKDSLGAVDAHYEALYDGLSVEFSGKRPKVLASSATLSGYAKQVDVLYRREARVFPVPPPAAGEGFWTASSERLMRKYIPLAPRGVTLEYMIDNLVTLLQQTVRSVISDPGAAASEMGIDPSLIDFLISIYGTNVVYGNTLRDLDAVDRSIETQVHVEGPVNKESLTGRDDFENIRAALGRLEDPEASFMERLHVITASSMMSHGVDIDRLNSMCMLGLPLTTSEFIQATARVGRAWPGFVFVAFKIGRERDAAMYRLFAKYIEHGDRFVEAIPITRRSRRVLDRTLPGLFMSRVLMAHEAVANRSLVMIPALRDFLNQANISAKDEAKVISEYLALDDDMDQSLREDLEEWMELFFRNLEQPSAGARFAGDCSPSRPPMRSLRDVEEQVPIHLPLTR